MKNYLDNPVYHALSQRDAHLGAGTASVKYFDEAVSPFVGFADDPEEGFEELHAMLSADRRILFATRDHITEPKGWKFAVAIEGLQFVFDGTPREEPSLQSSPLNKQHATQMVALAALTKPGPFADRTIEFGNYFGFFHNDDLIAMTGQRLHPGTYSEISAVCTHPDHLGKGYAAALLLQQLHIICGKGEIPFLHVRADNQRAIALYERLGFRRNGNMNFYFMKKA